MQKFLNDIDQKLSAAIQFFWRTRFEDLQSVRSGKHLDGFRELITDLLIAAGLDRKYIYWRNQTELPGWFRAEKSWDLLIVIDSQLIAVIELKSQVGSFGNNFNNRAEEALGSATDLWSAYEAGAFYPSPRPWLGYFILLEDADAAKQPIRVKEPHFKVFPDFQNASYLVRYKQLLIKLVRSRLYDAACLLTSSQEQGQVGIYHEPELELSFRVFLGSLLGQVMAVLQTRD